MNIPKHKRFIYKHAGLESPVVAVVTEGDMWHQIRDAIERDPALAKKEAETGEELFAATFRYATEFVGWLDDEWRTE